MEAVFARNELKCLSPRQLVPPPHHRQLATDLPVPVGMSKRGREMDDWIYHEKQSAFTQLPCLNNSGFSSPP